MKKALETVAGAAVAAEWYILYCVGATCWYGQPFPEFAGTLARWLVYGVCISAVLLLLWLACRVLTRRKRARRLGIIRMDRDGRYYYAKK